MACTWGSKVNGILTVGCIGIAVLIDLWDILDYKKGTTMVGNSCAFIHAGKLMACCRTTFTSTLWPVPLVLSLFRSLSTSRSSISILPFLSNPAVVTST